MKGIHYSAGWETRGGLEFTLLYGHTREVNQKLIAKETMEQELQNNRR